MRAGTDLRKWWMFSFHYRFSLPKASSNHTKERVYCFGLFKKRGVGIAMCMSIGILVGSIEWRSERSRVEI